LDIIQRKAQLKKATKFKSFMEVTKG
jgi:hypothetical protein